MGKEAWWRGRRRWKCRELGQKRRWQWRRWCRELGTAAGLHRELGTG